ncbi:hypothetical protein Bca52824_014305 [Brassica carinata]|uniref:Uncharacterized protein n=1 Tax=Brassica carinata TaxID=52824 RepID=A0A8X7W1B3_BRACI|nr:hypothetical protein Bca52824_014305 [Brassica carinata]
MFVSSHGDIYCGPTSTKYCGLHAVLIVDEFIINGELVFWCKSRSGIHLHDGVYIMVSAAMMVFGLHYEKESSELTYGIRDKEQ